MVCISAENMNNQFSNAANFLQQAQQCCNGFQQILSRHRAIPAEFQIAYRKTVQCVQTDHKTNRIKNPYILIEEASLGRSLSPRTGSDGVVLIKFIECPIMRAVGP